MKSIKQISLVLLVSILFTSCAKVFYSPDALTLAQNQKTFAIIPPTISITSSSKKITAETIKEQQRTESLNFQKEMYSWMLKRKMQGKITQEILDIETTNAKLIRAGFPGTPLTTTELCEVLGVDGIVTSNYSLSKPMSEVAAVAVAALVGAWGATNEVHVTMSINDYTNKKMIWNFDHKYSGSLGSSPSRIVDELMRQASKKMPYIIKKD